MQRKWEHAHTSIHNLINSFPKHKRGEIRRSYCLRGKRIGHMKVVKLAEKVWRKMKKREQKDS